MSLAMIVKIDPENPELILRWSTALAEKRKPARMGKPDFEQPAAAPGRANL